MVPVEAVELDVIEVVEMVVEVELLIVDPDVLPGKVEVDKVVAPLVVPELVIVVVAADEDV